MSFERTIQGIGVHVLFGAEWCNECEKLKKYADSILFEREDINVDDDPDIADFANITTLPTLLVYSNSEETKRLVGSASIREEIQPLEYRELADSEKQLQFYDSMDF